MTPDPDPLAAWIASARESVERHITQEALTERTVSEMPYGDLRKALKALEAALEASARWKRQSTTGYDATAQCAEELERVVGEKLLGEGETGG
jgi:Cdc6-like AAA superfamily ATPase